MDIIKQYIVQCITAASNNLRLSTQKIEVVALLRESISNASDIEKGIREMKKITELSKLAIKLNEIYNFLTTGQLDFLRLSEKFKEHSQYLIKDLSNMIDSVNPASFKQVLAKIEHNHAAEIPETNSIHEARPDVYADQTGRSSTDTVFDQRENEAQKENLIMEEEKQDDEAFFQNYESNILEHIKPVDTLLKQVLTGEYDTAELLKYAGIMERNGELSARIGFEIISNMHNIISRALFLIGNESISPLKEVIEAMRACLIVIVAVVKGKEIDITGYLNRAEEFGRQIQTIKK